MDVSYCHAVTDDGIKGLCSDEYVETTTKRMGQRKLLHTLKMKGTNVTKLGVEVALQNLPELRTFEFPHSVRILAELRRENLERGDFKTYPFTEFDCTILVNRSGNGSVIVPYKSGSLRLAANICPNVDVVHIRRHIGLTDVDLQGLLELKTLRGLVIPPDYPRGGQITFDGGIIPLLKAFGSFLRQLELYGLKTCVKIRSIAAHCTYLEILKLSDNSRYSMASLEKGSLYKEATFKKLKKLTVSCYKSPRFSSEMLFFLFSSPELKSVSLFGCDALTNEVLEKAASLHEFRNLLYIFLSSKNFVVFLRHDNERAL